MIITCPNGHDQVEFRIARPIQLAVITFKSPTPYYSICLATRNFYYYRCLTCGRKFHIVAIGVLSA